MNAQRALLAGIVDYAGLFPPAALSVPEAVRHYAECCADRSSWMLGRFVVPVGRLREAAAQWTNYGQLAGRLHMSAVLGADLGGDIARLHAFNDAADGDAVVDSMEVRLDAADAIASAADARRDVELFVEIPSASDPAPLITAIRDAGAHAKIRMGGLTEDVFPAAHDVVQFVRACSEGRVSFKATAGLHHPLRSEYRLTYDHASACASMYGFLNVFLAAAFLHAGMDEERVEQVLLERDPATFHWAADCVSWHEHSLSASRIVDARGLARSFGSCSFREPVDELQTIGLLA
jgi:hypothetical protein